MLIHDILLTFADVGINTLAIFDNGYYRKGIKDYRKWREENNINSKRAYYLKNKDYLRLTDETVELTDKALLVLRRSVLNNLKITRPKKWDNKWRLVSFDIPECKRRERDFFRRKLKELGFVKIQQSIFCHPYDCHREIIVIADYLDIKKYISFIEANYVETGENILQPFTD